MLCKNLSLNDYEKLREYTDRFDEVIEGNDKFRVDNPHRMWEYGQVLGLIDVVVKPTPDQEWSFLDVGGSYSPLGYVVRQLYPLCDVTVLDLEDTGHYSDNEEFNFAQADFQDTHIGEFDMVVSVSVIEHVPDFYSFWNNILASANKAVFISCDFHPSTRAFFDGQERTYNANSMYGLASIAKANGFQAVNYLQYNGPIEPVVMQYTFASLSLRRERFVWPKRN